MYWEITWALAKRELKGRYRGYWLGFLWTFADPVIQMAIFYFIFAIVFSRDYPQYLLYLMTGMLPYSLLNQGLMRATNSMITYGPLIRQIYCPRRIFVFVGIIAELYQFIFALTALIPLYFVYHYWPGLKILVIVPNTALLTVLIIGIGLVSSVANVFLRDTAHLIQLGLRMWFYITPIFYTTSMIKDLNGFFLFVYRLNPMVPILEVYRWALLENEPIPDLLALGIASLEILVLIVIGNLIFRRLDNSMVKML
jgi:ABC-type polysaccharide/polyol phosphate export permease